MPFLTQGKTNWKFVGILIVLAIIVGGGMLWLSGRLEFSSFEFPKIEKEVKEETIEWRTYENQKYGYEINYPSGLKIGNIEEFEKYDTPIEMAEIINWQFSSKKRPNVSLIISIIPRPYSPGESLLEYLGYDPDFCRIEKEEPTFAKISCQTNYRLLPVIGSVFVKNDKAFTILLLAKGPENLNKNDLLPEINLYNLMLSTFKFKEGVIEEFPNWQLKPVDGFSFEIYKGEKLIRTISRSEIIDEFKKKFKKNGYIYNEADSFYDEPMQYVYDVKRDRIIIPLSPFQIMGARYKWDFYIFDTKTNQFYIIPGSSFDRQHDAQFRPSQLTLSPDKNYLAYLTGYSGGTCVGKKYVEVIDLANLSPVDTSDQEKQIEKILKAKTHMDIRVALDEVVYSINNFSWISNSKIKASVNVGCLYLGYYPEAMEFEIEFEIKP